MFMIDKLPMCKSNSRIHTISDDDLMQGVESLPLRERSFLIFRLRGLTYAQIGKKFKVSRERARQIVYDATLKLLRPTRFTEIDGKLQFRSPHSTWVWNRNISSHRHYSIFPENT